MNRTKRSLTVCVWSLLIVTLLNGVNAAESPSPNIIMIMSDDQGWGDVGFNGNKDLKTPNLDSMAENGVRFDRFYAAAPL